MVLCRHQSPSVLVPALRTVGNIVTGDDLQTQVIINCGALPCLLNLLTTSHKKSIKKEACWTISNITAGTKEQVRPRTPWRVRSTSATARDMHCITPERPKEAARHLLFSGV